MNVIGEGLDSAFKLRTDHIYIPRLKMGEQITPLLFPMCLLRGNNTDIEHYSSGVRIVEIENAPKLAVVLNVFIGLGEPPRRTVTATLFGVVYVAV
jgi:hypothetical protein